MYFNANGVELFYEKTGQGMPIILLHGNGEDHTIFDVLIKQLSPNFTVYAIDSRDHGRSSRVKSLNYEEMMEDVAAFIHGMRIQTPILYGFSDGGIIGLLLAIKYKSILTKLIVSGANTHPGGIKWFTALQMKLVYFFTRNRKYKLMLTQPSITETELKTIITPTLVLAGGKDMVKDEHTRMIAKNIPSGTLIILDGENHSSYVSHSEKLYGIIKPFICGR